MTGVATDGLAAVATLCAYKGTVLPAVRAELEGWRRSARQISNPVLRRDALAAITEKAANAEATAVLATLAPRATRRSVIRASTALQVAIDYLDNLVERDVPDPLCDGLQLHLALGTALTPGGQPTDWYRHHPERDDSGYLDSLVGACQEAVAGLPSWPTVAPFARRAVERCGEGQSHTHAAALDSGEKLEAWASSEAFAGFDWWEVAAGASSSVGTHALVALAAEPGSTIATATAVDAAYFPAIGALTVILDDLVDRKADADRGEHNYLRYYSNDAVAAQRLATICEHALGRVETLPHRLRHRAILSGVVAYYLRAAPSQSPIGDAARSRILAAAGSSTRPLAAFLRWGG